MIPILQKGPFLQELIEKIEKYQKVINPDKQFVLVILFSKIGLLNLFKRFPIIRNVINILCIGKSEKFEEILSDNREQVPNFSLLRPDIH